VVRLYVACSATAKNGISNYELAKRGRDERPDGSCFNGFAFAMQARALLKSLA